MSDERRTYLDEVAAVLWPHPHTVMTGRGRATGQEVDRLLVLPSLRRPRLLVPTDPRAAAAVVRHHGEGRSARGRWAATALAVGLRAGLGALLQHERLTVSAPRGCRTETLVAHLSEALGQQLVMGMHLGPPRSNRKPVLQLLDHTGRTVAYAKVAVDDLTDSLLRTETAALAELAAVDTRIVTVARTQHAGLWQGRAVLVQSALPVWSHRRPLTTVRHLAAIAEVAAIGRHDGVPLAGSPFWADLSARLSRLPAGEAADRLRGLVRRLEAAARDTCLSLGAAHGDWTPWNMASLENRLLVWDWERFRRDVPVGFDLLHYGLQTALVVRGTDPVEAARQLLGEAAERLRPLGVSAVPALLTGLLYGTDLAVRYLTDRQQEAGAIFGDVGTWLLPALADGIGRLEGERR